MDFTPTRSAYLELRDERNSMQEGYRFLDEKLMVLAAEILQQLEAYESTLQEFEQLYSEAGKALQGAIARHGLSGIELYPAVAAKFPPPRITERSVLGLALQELHENSASDDKQPSLDFNASPEGEATRRLFQRLIRMIPHLSAIGANLLRLETEYQTTSRRARALEDVLLPELDQSLSQIDVALEEMEKEEIVRMHFSAELR